MTPQELHEAHLMSLILQRDEIVQRLMELNSQIKEFKKENPMTRLSKITN